MAEPVDYVSIAEKNHRLPMKIVMVQKLTRFLSLLSPVLASHFLMKIFSRPGRFKKQYSLGSKTHVFLINNKKIKVYEEGNGPKVLIFHGWGGSAYQMRHIMKYISENGYSAIACDAPAHGMSEGSTTDGREYANTVEYLMKFFKPIGIVSHSFGNVATLVALSNSSTTIEKYIAISLPVNDDPLFGIFFRTFKVPPKTQKEMIKQFEKQIGVKIDDYLPINMKIQLPPTTIIHDKNDFVTKFDDMMSFALKHPECKVIATEGLGHRKILKDKFVLETIVKELNNIHN